MFFYFCLFACGIHKKVKSILHLKVSIFNSLGRCGEVEAGAQDQCRKEDFVFPLPRPSKSPALFFSSRSVRKYSWQDPWREEWLSSQLYFLPTVPSFLPPSPCPPPSQDATQLPAEGLIFMNEQLMHMDEPLCMGAMNGDKRKLLATPFR